MAQELTKETFVEKISDIEVEDFKFKGDKPAVIDFWAPWCGPCKMVSPIIEKLGERFEGRVDVYKVNVDEQQELAATFGIQSIPSFLFIPKEGEPQMAVGALPESKFEQAFEEIFDIK